MYIFRRKKGSKALLGKVFYRKKWVFMILIFTFSCTVGPKVDVPDMQLKKAFSEDAFSSEEIDIKDWWHVFNDPQLDELICLAIEGNKDLMIAIDRIEKARVIYRQVSGRLWPSIDVTASAIRSRFSENLFTASFLGPSTQSSFQLGFDAFWELDFFGRLKKEREAAAFTILGQEEEFAATMISLVSEVAMTYIDLCALQEDLAVLREKILLQEEVLTLIQSAVDAGLQNERALEKEKIALVDVQEMCTEVEKNQKKQLHKLALLLGEMPDKNSSLFTRIQKIASVPKAPFLVKVGMPSSLLQRRPDVRKAEKELAKAAALVGSSVAELFPSFSLTAYAGLNANKLSKWFDVGSRSWTIGPSMVLPVFRFGQTLGKIDARNAELKAALHTYENQVLLAIEDVENALASYLQATFANSFRDEALNAAKREMHLEKDAYLTGIHSFFAYAEVQNRLLTQKRRSVSAKRAAAKELVALYKALGGGWSC